MLLKYDKKRNVLTISHVKDDVGYLNDVQQVAMFMDKNQIRNVVLICDFMVTYTYITHFVTLLRAKLLAIGSKKNGKFICHWIRENLTDETHDRVMSVFNN